MSLGEFYYDRDRRRRARKLSRRTVLGMERRYRHKAIEVATRLQAKAKRRYHWAQYWFFHYVVRELYERQERYYAHAKLRRNTRALGIPATMGLDQWRS